MGKARPLTVNLLSLFPGLLIPAFEHSILKRAQTKGLFQPQVVDIRAFTRDRHHTADDQPYGGGSGMVMKVEPIARALASLKRGRGTGPVFLLAPTGKRFDQAFAQRLARLKQFTLICGRYEGVDQRVEKWCDDELSIGDYVLSGGEPAAVVVVDAVVRLIPNVLGAQDSAALDSFSDGLLDHPHFTRPLKVGRQTVPAVLLSGDHAAVAAWRREQQLERTLRERPDLLDQAKLSSADQEILSRLRTGKRRRQSHEQN